MVAVAACTGSLHPGPIDPHVLYSQDKHRSQDIWDTGAEDLLCCRRNDSRVHLHHDRRDIRVQRYLYMTGFYGLYHIGYTRLDRPLITALIERWRPETHTFHMPPGECTVTLQDIQVLAGVRVDGKPVTGLDASRSKEQWQDIVEHLLGERPELGDLRGGGLKLSWINDRFNKLPDGADDEVVRRHTRAVILLLLGGQYLSDKTNNMVKLMYLPLLEDLENCERYSWGSAILAHLYREMCRATCSGALEIAGPLVLLQIWAWNRLTQIRPRCFSELPVCPEIPAPADGGPSLPIYPHGYRWRIGTRGYDPEVVGHNLRHYRDQFDLMRDEQIVWEPYVAVLKQLPDYCVDGQAVWRARAPLICFAIIEYHYPDRVLRQFGMRQEVPRDCIRNDKVHSLDRRGKVNVDWEAKHRAYVDAWAARHEAIVSADLYNEPMPANDQYMLWYGRITRRYMRSTVHVPSRGFQPTAAIQATMMLALRRCYMMAMELKHSPMIELLETTFREINFDPREIPHLTPVYVQPLQSQSMSKPQPQRKKRNKIQSKPENPSPHPMQPQSDEPPTPHAQSQLDETPPPTTQPQSDEPLKTPIQFQLDEPLQHPVQPQLHEPQRKLVPQPRSQHRKHHLTRPQPQRKKYNKTHHKSVDPLPPPMQPQSDESSTPHTQLN